MKYGLSGTFTTLPGKSDELVNILLQAGNLLEDNEDCIDYIVSTTNKPDVVSVTEVWISKDAHDAALESAEARTLIQKAMPLIVSMSQQTEVQVVGGKGL